MQFNQVAILIFALSIFLSCGLDAPPKEIDMDMEVNNFGLLDQNGNFHELYYLSDAKAVVLYIQGNACPIVRNAITDLKAVRAKYADKGVKFLMLNSNLQDDRTSIAQEAEEFDIDFPILVDEAQLIGESLQLYRTAETLVLDPETWTIAYRGPINDRLGYESQRNEAKNNYLDDALAALLNGEILEKNIIKSKGCLIKFANKDKAKFAEISYEKDVAPILVKKCMRCHVEGGIAPWAMKDYKTVYGWSNMMREVLRVKRMPPWHADPHYGEWSNDLSLSNKELQTLVHWIDAGAKKEGGKDPLVAYTTQPDEWKLGEPHLLFELNKEDIPATGIIDYRYQEFEVPLNKEVWATAIQVIPGNTQVLHHLLVSVIYPDGYVEPMDRRSPWLDGLFASWAPGIDVEVFPEGTGRHLPKGSKLWFQLHYTTNGKAQSDRSKVGVYYTEEAPEKEYLIAGPFNPEIVIPPNEGNYQNKTMQVFDKEVTLYGLAPHMHFRGKAMKYTAIYPDGSTEILLNVPNYNFNWQRYYRLKHPQVLPAGTKVLIEAAFDNSPRNTFNPAPEKTVYWGDFSVDEMLIGYMSFHYGRQGDSKEKSLSLK